MADPFAEPVKLPWETGGKRLISVRADEGPDCLPGSAFIGISDADEGSLEIWLSSQDLYQLARAVWTAASQVEGNERDG